MSNKTTVLIAPIIVSKVSNSILTFTKGFAIFSYSLISAVSAKHFQFISSILGISSVSSGNAGESLPGDISFNDVLKNLCIGAAVHTVRLVSQKEYLVVIGLECPGIGILQGLFHKRA